MLHDSRVLDLDKPRRQFTRRSKWVICKLDMRSLSPLPHVLSIYTWQESGIHSNELWDPIPLIRIAAYNPMRVVGLHNVGCFVPEPTWMYQGRLFNADRALRCPLRSAALSQSLQFNLPYGHAGLCFTSYIYIYMCIYIYLCCC